MTTSEQKTVNDWITYHEIWRLLREGLNLQDVAKAIRLDFSTVKKYAGMNETDLIKISGQYFALVELPYGFQAQVDFGQCIIPNENSRRRTIYFFAMMLSRSQMLFLRFSEAPFTAESAIDAHEQAFEFFKGIPREVIYHRDRSVVSRSRSGKLLMAQDFKSYVFEQQFRAHLCSKSPLDFEPKASNMIKFVKDNFLCKSTFYDIETLQFQSENWLKSIGNGMPHSTRNRTAFQEWLIEQPYLHSWCTVKLLPSYIHRSVYEDDTFFYNGYFYCVTKGTFKKKGSVVRLYLRDDELHVYDAKEEIYLCKHKVFETRDFK